MAKSNFRRGVEERRELFIAAYMANGRNGKEAAITAGYAAKNANVQAFKLLGEPKVAERIAVLNKELLIKHNMTADTVMKQLAAIVHFDMRKLFDEHGNMKAIQDLDDDTASALASIEVEKKGGRHEDSEPTTVTKFKMFDKNQAVKNAMQHYKLLQGEGATINIGLVQISATDAELG